LIDNDIPLTKFHFLLAPLLVVVAAAAAAVTVPLLLCLFEMQKRDFSLSLIDYRDKKKSI
jgi:hypothetical protein